MADPVTSPPGSQEPVPSRLFLESLHEVGLCIEKQDLRT